jgi:hypothetical protein
MEIMVVKRKCFSLAVLKGISEILGDTNEGLTGSEIEHYLAQANIKDTFPLLKKSKRLFNAFGNYQNNTKCSNNILDFIALSLAPASYVNKPEEFIKKKNLINQQLSFIGYQFNHTGKFSEITQAKTITEAQRKADDLKSKLENRNAHIQIFKYCKA